jgi:hypothetical protein
MERENLPENITLLEIVSHRTNPLHTDYLFEIVPDEQIQTNEFYVFFENQHCLWIKDTLCLSDYVTYVPSVVLGNHWFMTERMLVNKIYRYCCEKEIKILYVYMHRPHSIPSPLFSDEELDAIELTIQANYERQVNSLNYLRRLFPDHKVIHSDFKEHEYDSVDYDYSCLSRVMKMMKRGDIFYTFNIKTQRVLGSDVILLTKRFENIPTTHHEVMNIRRHNHIQMKFEDIKTLTEDYITLLDQDFYYKKSAIDTVVLAAHNRISENSSLKILPPHLLRELARWF